MKTKFTLLAAAMAGMFIFSACDPTAFMEDIIDSNDGEMSVTTSNASGGQQHYGTDAEVKFEAMLCDFEEGSGTLRFIGMANKLTDNMRVSTNTYPIAGITLKYREEEHTYHVSSPLTDTAFLLHMDWSALVTGDNENNMALIAVGDEEFYIAASGDVYLDSLSVAGGQTTGTLQNVVMRYITKGKIEHLRALSDTIRMAVSDPVQYGAAGARCGLELNDIRENMNGADSYFPCITFNGTYKAFRAPLSSYMNAINGIE